MSSTKSQLSPSSQQSKNSMDVLSPSIREASKEVNDFWRSKVRFYFTEILDFDSDGHVSSKDVDAFKDMYKYIKNLQHDSPELERFSRFLNIWIQNILSITNENNSAAAVQNHTAKPPTETTISLGDFTKYCESIRRELTGRVTWPASLDYMSHYIDALFHILDTDNDGFISKEDFLSNYASPEDYTSRMASWEILASKDPNYRLEKKRFDQLCIEFLVSTNPDDPGNWIFGTFTH